MSLTLPSGNGYTEMSRMNVLQVRTVFNKSVRWHHHLAGMELTERNGRPPDGVARWFHIVKLSSLLDQAKGKCLHGPMLQTIISHVAAEHQIAYNKSYYIKPYVLTQNKSRPFDPSTSISFKVENLKPNSCSLEGRCYLKLGQKIKKFNRYAYF